MSGSIVKGYYSRSCEEYIADIREQIHNYKDPQTTNTNTENKTISTKIKDEYISSSQSSSDQQSSSTYAKPNSNVNGAELEKLCSKFENKWLWCQSYLWTQSMLNCNLSAVDIASSNYGQKTVEINGGKTALDFTTVNGEPKIYSLNEIYQYVKDDLETIIQYKVVEPSSDQAVPKEVEKLGEWYVEHWNEISVSYVSSEGKIVSTEDKELTREEEMKLYALKSAVLSKQLWANEKSGVPKEDYKIRDFLSFTGGQSAKLTGVPDTSYLFKLANQQRSSFADKLKL
jgi:hypothetical protein